MPARKKPPESQILTLIDKAIAVARTARRNNKSLGGDNFYGRKFLDLKIAVRLGLDGLLQELGTGDTRAGIMEIASQVNMVFDPDSPADERSKSRTRILEVLRTVIEPARLKPAYAPAGTLFSLSIVEETRPYVEGTARQALGCYELGWYDASAVMLRRLLETLIIETYENHGLAERIKDGQGDFLKLSDLIDRVLQESAWNLSRNTKKALPRLKNLGDLAAHNRRIITQQGDLDKLQLGLRTAVQELVHLAAYDIKAPGIAMQPHR